MRGQSVVELLMVLLIFVALSAIAIPSFSHAVQEGRLRGAAFYLSSRVALLRMQAVRRYANVALRFTNVGSSYRYQTFGDGDGDGVRSADIATGRDPALDTGDEIGNHFEGVRFGFIPGCPLIDGSTVAAGANPIRIGSSGLLVFAPSGTATSGTLYLRGQGDTAYAVVILGATGRTRLLRCTARTGTWSHDGS
jgi:type II secretory pathway pseudopilin PulG